MKQYKILIWLITLLIIWDKSNAASKVDSLTLLLADSKDTNKVNILNELCLALYISNTDEALKYGTEAITLATKLSFKNGLSSAYNRVGIVYDVTGKYEKALQFYEIALKYSNEIKNENRVASIQNNIGMIYWNRGDYANALEYYFKSSKIFEKIKAEKGLANTYNNIGLVYWEDKQLDKALNFQKQALDVRRKIKDNYGIGASLTNIGLIYHDKKEYKLSLEYFNESLVYKEKINDEYGLGITYKAIAASYEKLGETDNAIIYFNRAIEKKKKVDDKYGLASTYIDMSGIYNRKKDYKSSENSLFEANKIALELKSNKILHKTYNGLAYVNYLTGNYKKAYEFMKQYSAAYDSMFNEEKSKQISELQTKYETEKKEQAIAILNRDNEIQQLQIKRKNLLLIFFGIVSLVILLILGILYQRNRIKQQKILQEEKEKQQQLRLKAIIDTQESERNRISRDLHDGIGQLLAAAKINFSSFEDELVEVGKEKKELFEHSTKILNEAITEVSSISQQMMPRALRENGLVPAAENLLEKTFSRTNIKYNFQQINFNGRIAENIEVGLYRILQELIGNIVKHSRATETTIQLTKTQKNIILTVEDNGIGIPKDLKKKGMGLDNIESRALSLNGIYHFESELGNGSISTIRIPI